jgi:hypothetical protein
MLPFFPGNPRQELPGSSIGFLARRIFVERNTIRFNFSGVLVAIQGFFQSGGACLVADQFFKQVFCRRQNSALLHNPIGADLYGLNCFKMFQLISGQTGENRFQSGIAGLGGQFFIIRLAIQLHFHGKLKNIHGQ